jgi:hypothetical protein
MEKYQTPVILCVIHHRQNRLERTSNCIPYTYISLLVASGLLGFWTFSIVWYSREHDVSETGSVFILR